MCLCNHVFVFAAVWPSGWIHMVWAFPSHLWFSFWTLFVQNLKQQYYVKDCIFCMELLRLKGNKTLCLEYLCKFSNFILLCRLPTEWYEWCETSGIFLRFTSACVYWTLPAAPMHLPITCNTWYRWKGQHYTLETWRQDLTQRAVNVRVWLDNQVLRLDHLNIIEWHSISGAAEVVPHICMLLVLSAVVLDAQLIFFCWVKCRHTVFISISIW
jgi:hypothetical protein